MNCHTVFVLFTQARWNSLKFWLRHLYIVGRICPPPPLSWNRFDIGGKRWLGRIPTVPPVFRRACYTYSFFLLLVHSTSNFKIQWHVEIQKTLTLRLYRVTQVVFSFVKPPFLSSVYKKVYSLFNVYFLCCILLE